MSRGHDPNGSSTLTFGDQEAEPSLPGSGSAPLQPGSQAPRPRPLNTARRAKQRRRAAQRRSRAKMRDGSEGLLAFLVLLALTLLLIDLQTDGRAYDAPRAASAALLGPLQAGTDQVLRGGQPDLELVAEQEQQLAEQTDRTADLARLRELEALFGLAESAEQLVIGASVVALGARSGGTLGATIDRGSQQGVARDQSVVAGGGLVGRISTAGPASAVVQLTADAEFAVGARLAESGESAIVRGTGDPDRLEMQLLDPLAELEPGQRVVTIGSQQTPAGLVVGTVTDIGDPRSPSRTVALQPAADLTRLSVVGVATTAGEEGSP